MPSSVLPVLSSPRTLAVLGIVLMTGACGDASADVTPPVEAAVSAPVTTPASAAPTLDELTAKYPAYADGLRIYREQFCGTCHTFTPAGTGGVFGPSHDGLRETADRHIHDPAYTGTAKTAEEYVRESILQPGAYRASGYEVTRFLMPAYVNLSAADVDAVVHLLLDLDPGD